MIDRLIDLIDNSSGVLTTTFICRPKMVLVVLLPSFLPSVQTLLVRRSSSRFCRWMDDGPCAIVDGTPASRVVIRARHPRFCLG